MYIYKLLYKHLLCTYSSNALFKGDPIPQSDWTINNLNQSGNDYESPGLSSPRKRA